MASQYDWWVTQYGRPWEAPGNIWCPQTWPQVLPCPAEILQATTRTPRIILTWPLPEPYRRITSPFGEPRDGGGGEGGSRAGSPKGPAAFGPGVAGPWARPVVIGAALLLGLVAWQAWRRG
jgi:hypothetical protein